MTSNSSGLGEGGVDVDDDWAVGIDGAGVSTSATSTSCPAFGITLLLTIESCESGCVFGWVSSSVSRDRCCSVQSSKAAIFHSLGDE